MMATKAPDSSVSVSTQPDDDEESRDEKKAEEKWGRDWEWSPDWLLITENNGSAGYNKVQGSIALLDSQIDDGGFQIIPGFNHVLKQWAESNTQFKSGSFVSVPINEPWLKKPYPYRVTMRAGSLVVWSSTMPHCNFPNTSSRFRMCQYIKMFPLWSAQTPAYPALHLQSRTDYLDRVISLPHLPATRDTSASRIAADKSKKGTAQTSKKAQQARASASSALGSSSSSSANPNSNSAAAYRTGLTMTPLGRKLFGLDEW